MNEESSFESIFQKLETIVERLEDGDISLDESLKLFEQGVLLCRTGSQKLEKAEHVIEQLVQSKTGEMVLLPWEEEEGGE